MELNLFCFGSINMSRLTALAELDLTLWHLLANFLACKVAHGLCVLLAKWECEHEFKQS
jgi:hypothetical protein